MDEKELKALSELERALAVAALYHAGAEDKAGSPYILHVLRVMMGVERTVEKVAALLHDLLEDTDLKEEDLHRLHFSPETIQTVLLLTRKPEEPYRAYIKRLSVDEVAVAVKLSDLRDNQNRGRLREPLSPEDKDRLEKYRAAEEFLRAVLEKKEKSHGE